MICCLLNGSAFAQTDCDFNVAANDTPGLISALSNASSYPTTQVICLGGGTYTLTASNHWGSAGANGLPLITSGIIIEGNGAVITHSSAEAFRFFQLTLNGRLTLHQLTLSNGSGTARGGAIYSAGLLTLDTVTVQSNTAPLEGGGLFIDRGSANVRRSTIAGNTTTNNQGKGGGIFLSRGSLNIENSTISGNTIPGGSLMRGGGIHITADTGVTNSTISGNTTGANGFGGGIYKTGGTLNFSNVTFYGNLSPTTPGRQSAMTAALRPRSRTLLLSRRLSTPITNTRFIDNSATEGNGSAIRVSSGAVSVSGSCSVNNNSFAVYRRSANRPLSSCVIRISLIRWFARSIYPLTRRCGHIPCADVQAWHGHQ